MEIVPAKHISRITGAANLVVSGQQRPDIAFRYAGIIPNSGFAVIGPIDEESRIVVIHESDAMRWLPAQIPGAAPN